MKWKVFFKRQAKNPKYLKHGDVVEATVAHRRRRDRPRHPAHGGQVRVSVPHVPVVVLGAGPTGITVATLLAQYGVDCLVLDRWTQVYPQPRAVHLDDEIFRIVARLGIADEFAAISRPALGLRLLDRSMTVLAEFSRDTALSRNGFPQANMFDQPEFEALLRTNLARYPRAELRGDVEVTDVSAAGADRVRVTYTDRSDGTEHVVEADYVLGCDGANSIARRRIGARMDDLGFEQRWLVVDVATAADLDQWEGVHQVCDPHRAATYMRIGATRYRWEFRLLRRRDRRGLSDTRRAGATAAAVGRRSARRRPDVGPRHRVHLPRATGRPLAPGPGLPARRRRPPHPAVHRAGHGRRDARRDEPRLEAGGRAHRHAPIPMCWTPTRRNESPTPGP